MFGIDGLTSDLAGSQGGFVVIAIGFVLGLRHASDPDHLVAVSVLVANTRERSTRAAALLGAAWGAGHATTLLLFGLPVVLLHARVPAAVESLAEFLIGAVIVALALRLLMRWRRGAFHGHAHEHASTSTHAHVHSHARGRHHRHGHKVRSPAEAFSIGLLHGAAGSAAVAVLVVAAVPERPLAVAALLALVSGAGLSMAMLSALVGRLLSVPAARGALAAAVPVLGSFACLFGTWWMVGAIRGF